MKDFKKILEKYNYKDEINPYLHSELKLMGEHYYLPNYLRQMENTPHSQGQYLIFPKDKKTVNEGLIKTYPTIFFLKRLSNELSKRYLILNDYNIDIKWGNDKNVADIIMILVPDTEFSDIYYYILKQVMELCGYYITAETHINSETFKNNGKPCYYFQIEPIYPQKENDLIGKYLYHITTLNAFKKIQKIGFIPKSGSKLFKYPPRIYFFTKYDLNLFENYIIECRKQNIIFFNNDLKDTNEFVIIQINIDNLKGVRFFKDNSFSQIPIACYTYNNVSKEAINGYRFFEYDYPRENSEIN